MPKEHDKPCPAYCYDVNGEREYCDDYLPAVAGGNFGHMHTEGGISEQQFEQRLRAYKMKANA